MQTKNSIPVLSFIFCICICITLLILLAGCRKNHITHSVQGQLFPCNSNILFANRRVAIYQESQQHSTTTMRGEGQTDVDGKFSFSYTTTDGISALQFVLGDGDVSILAGLSSKEDIHDLNIYRLESTIITPLVVSLNVINPYTNNDTLNFYDTSFPSNTRKIAGPFVSGRAFSQVYQASYYIKREINGNDLEYHCGLNKPNTGNSFESAFFLPFVTRCEIDTAYVILDIQ